jgi:Methyltransferase domain
MVNALVKREGVIAELGVAIGDFSDFLLNSLSPKQFVAIDLFALHTVPELWGQPTSEIFGSGLHIDQYRSRFARFGDCLMVEQGVSWEVLARYPDRYFDMIYIDAGHEFEAVRNDTEVAVDKIRTDGVLIFNDYTMHNPDSGGPYGVVQNVNALVVESDWRVAGLALQANLFCDIALTWSESR